MIERVLDGRLDDPGCFLRRELVLGLALELGLANEHGEHRSRRAITSSAVICAALRLHAIAEFTQALRKCRTETVLVRAAFAGRYGVAVRAAEAIGIGNPGDRPLHRTVLALTLDLACEYVLRNERLTVDLGGEIIAQPTREVETSLRPGVSSLISEGSQLQRISTPRRD